MIISQKQVQTVLSTYTRNRLEAEKGQAPASPPRARPEDRVSFSPRARELLLARSVIEGTPDIREDKVAELKQALQDGSYQVDAQQVAEKMVGRFLADKMS